MSTQTQGSFHRRGVPGGQGCRVNLVPIHATSPEGKVSNFALLDAGKEASEIELLRTLAKGLGAKWGQDEFGWWAAVPEAPHNGFAAALYKAATDPALANSPHSLYREGEKGAKIFIAQFDTRAAAEQHAKELAAGGEVRHYFVEPVVGKTDS